MNIISPHPVFLSFLALTVVFDNQNWEAFSRHKRDKQRHTTQQQPKINKIEQEKRKSKPWPPTSCFAVSSIGPLCWSFGVCSWLRRDANARRVSGVFRRCFGQTGKDQFKHAQKILHNKNRHLEGRGSLPTSGMSWHALWTIGPRKRPAETARRRGELISGRKIWDQTLYASFVANGVIPSIDGSARPRWTLRTSSGAR